MSEYGFQSFPEYKTVKFFTIEEDWDIYSEVMQAHQRSSIGNKTIANYLDRHFNEPKDFESFLYVSQLLQAEGVKIAMEAHRINKPFNMGTLIWQLNDCWPVASWSSIDYFGRWKALHYYAKRAFQETIIAFESNEDELKVQAVTESYDDLRATLIVELLDFNGKKIYTDEKKIKTKANSSQVIWKNSLNVLLKKQRRNEVYLRAKILSDNKIIAENIYLFVPHKDLKLETPDIKYEFIDQGQKLFVELKADKTSFGVCFESNELDLIYSDNYFTLHAKESKLIELTGDFKAFEVKNKLTVKSLIDSYTP
jgi:beta-mannosidase